jgi:diguanylate cyclase (GGDEF)-like protein/PAS domain S-box-containing protein
VKNKILVVEDESIVVLSLKRVLKNLNYDVVDTAAAGEDAILKAKLHNPDLILMDIFLKGDMNGIEAAQRITSSMDIPVVFLTAFSDAEIIEKVKKTEPYGYIIKPFEDRELQVVLENALYKHKIDKELKEKKKWLTAVLKGIGDAVIATDREGCVKFVNPVAENLTGWKEEEIKDKLLKDVLVIIDEETNERIEKIIARVVEKGTIGTGNNFILISKDGSSTSIEDSIAPIRDDFGNVTGIVLVFRDITQRKKAEDELRYLSFHDKLTGLYNRAFFEHEMQRLDTERQLPMTIVMGDVNGLKLVNDAFSHKEGDKLLQEIAKLIKSSCREEDIVARWGGDEFTILLPKAGLIEAQDICRRIKESCEQENENLMIRASIALGTAVKNKKNTNISEILIKAEDAMYKNKMLENSEIKKSIIDSIEVKLYYNTDETERHVLRLQELSERIGLKLRMSTNNIEKLRLISRLHDIGKTGISGNIFRKKDLTKEDWEEIRKHPERGYHIVKGFNGYVSIAEIVLTHHEWWNGKGYPQSLKREEIPYLARLFAIIDAYEIMTGGNHYKEPVSHEKAVKELEKYSGEQFDPHLVNKFLSLWQ